MESRIPSFASGVFHFGPEINLDDSSIVSIRGSKSFKNFQDTWRANQDITVMAATYGPFRDLVDKPITGFEELAELPLQNILNPFRPPTESNISQWIANQHIRRALAIADDAQYEADVYLESIHRVERLITKSLGLPIKFRLERNPITLKAEQNGESISINQLSDGTRSFLSWTLDYLSRASRVNWKDPAQAAIAPGIILVDEIDSHLHPEWQRRVMADAMDLLPETHIIATTHSPFVVGSADDTQVFRIYKDEQNQFQVASHYDEFFGYPADLVLQKLFTDSLYTPKIQRELDRLSELAAKLAGGAITEDERQEHDHLLGKLANVSSWIANLLAMTRQTNNGVSR
ncbi:MAG: AAA family ATPase [Chloroflexota bacterium]